MWSVNAPINGIAHHTITPIEATVSSLYLGRSLEGNGQRLAAQIATRNPWRDVDGCTARSSAHRADHDELLQDGNVVRPVDHDELGRPVSARHREGERCESVCVCVAKFVGN